MADPIRDFFRQCDPSTPLMPDDDRYVHPEKGVRGEGDPVEALTNALRWADKPLHVLFAGHRGCGKSTELLRLKKALMNPPAGQPQFFVVYFEADDEDIDVNDADLPDILLAIVRQVGKALREALKIDLRKTRLATIVEQVTALLKSEVEFEAIELDAKIATVTAAIKTSPDARDRIRRALEPHVSNISSATNELLREASIKLRQKGYEDLVLIVDNLDRLVFRQLPDGQGNTHDRLFINRGGQLAGVDCHVLYTLPISMVYSNTATTLTNIYGGRPTVLPMLKVADREGKKAAGHEVMRQVAEKRAAKAGIDLTAAFGDDETLDYFCRMSGGHMRNFLILLRSACMDAGNLPLTLQAAEGAVRGLSTDFERALNSPAYFEVLEKVRATQKLPGSDFDRILLYNLSILEYLNATAWYEVNPVVRLLGVREPATGAASPGKKKGKAGSGKK